MTDEHQDSRHTKRDADVLRVLGIFLIVLSVPVVVGTYWAEGGVPALINLGAGLIIMAIGTLMFIRGRRPAQ